MGFNTANAVGIIYDIILITDADAHHDRYCAKLPAAAESEHEEVRHDCRLCFILKHSPARMSRIGAIFRAAKSHKMPALIYFELLTGHTSNAEFLLPTFTEAYAGMKSKAGHTLRRQEVLHWLLMFDD